MPATRRKRITVLDPRLFGAGWTTLVVAGVAAVLACIVFAPAYVAWAVGIGTVAVWIAWGFFASYHWSVTRQIHAHLGRKTFADAGVVEHRVPTAERVNLQLALDRLRVEDDGGFPVFGVNDYATLAALVRANQDAVPLKWEALPRSAKETLNCATNALYLLRHDGRPFCALVRRLKAEQGARGRRRFLLEVFAATEADSRAALDRVLHVAREVSVYRGSVVTLEENRDPEERYAIKFHELPRVDRGAIILPETLLTVIDRNVLGFLARRETLRQAGQSTRHGLLLHGPPGTGKTLVTKYLAGASGATVVLLQGRRMALVREACQLARLLAPAVVVLEDVDLVAQDRRVSRRTDVLGDLMEEMDGLGPHADCVFLLTTNRPETLETALASRPGRVDQAIYFPLPDRDDRRRLFATFGRGLDLSAVDLEPLLDRTDGASPAFIKELFRKAALLAAERDEAARPLRVAPADFDAALREIVEFGGELTQNILGFPRRPAAR